MAAGSWGVWSGAVLGAAPGVVCFVVAVFVGGEAGLSIGTIGILLAIVGAMIGGVAGSGAIVGVTSGPSLVVGAIIGALPGLALIPYETRFAIVVVVTGALIGVFVGGSRRHGPPVQ